MKQTENEMNVNVPLEVIKASEIEPKEVKWLWYPYIPFGKVTLLQGDPGDGKSKLMLSIAALLSKGEALPFTDEETEPMTIIYQTTEDDADDTVVPRFNSAGGNADYVAGVVDSEDYQLIREDYSKQYDGLRAALQRAEAKKVEVEQQIREYLNMTSNLEEHLDDFGFDAQLVKSLVQRIEVSADKRIRIVFGFQDVFADLGKESAGK